MVVRLRKSLGRAGIVCVPSRHRPRGTSFGRLVSGESALPEAGFSPRSTCRHLPGIWPSAPHPPSLGGGGSVPKIEAAEEERVGEALFEKASEYLDLCRSTFSVDKAQQAGRLGAELISSAGTVEKAVHVFNTVRVQKLGDHLAGAKQNAFKGISPLHQEYLQVCAQDGVPSRREKPLAREEAKNHGSVYGYEEELLQKAWKDAAYGAALFVDPEVGKVSQLLDQAKVAESPLGRVPKQNPDRTISSEGRPINDMRRQNDAGSKFNHPPAPQPRHHAVARQSLCGGEHATPGYRKSALRGTCLALSNGTSCGRKTSPSLL